MIYFIQAEPNGRIKIGRSNSPEKRLANMQVGSPVKLKLIGTKNGGLAEEKHMHVVFSSHWSHGEWFEPAKELVDFILSLHDIPKQAGLDSCECTACGHKWNPRGLRNHNIVSGRDGFTPAVCPKCHTCFWNKPFDTNVVVTKPTVKTKSEKRVAAGLKSAATRAIRKATFAALRDQQVPTATPAPTRRY